MPADHDILWALSDFDRQQTALWQFAGQTRSLHQAAPGDYDALHAWSVDSPAAFYEALWNFLDIIGDKGDTSYEVGEDIRSARFYPDARLNYAENLLRDADDRLAIIAHRDDGTRRTLTRRELYDQVSRLVQALQDAGITTGDRIAAIVTNDMEAIVGYLASSAIGAIWSSCSPDFGPVGAADRLCQTDPKILLAVSDYSYGGKHIDITATIRAVAEGCNAQQIILLADNIDTSLTDLPCTIWQDFIAPWQPQTIAFKRLPYTAPLAILFSSGTTGKPKCIVHSAMGLLLQHKKELILHCDLKAGEHFFYYTTCGWMMWNWQVSGLAAGATLVTFDGNPFYPSKQHLLQLVKDEKIQVFGTSAKYIAACENAGMTTEKDQLASLRLVLSTGSPLLPSGFDYVYDAWKKDLHLASISGGTDICGCFLGGNPLLPVVRGELQCAFLGMAVDVFDEAGNPVTGVAGELVCTHPHLSMPLGLRGDMDGSAYQDAYFSRFPGVWAHGDYVEKRDSGGYVIHGRSDTTLNPGGVRIGTAEIYRLVESIDEVEECIAVGQDWHGDQRIILFVVLADNRQLDPALDTHIKQQIRQGATPRHVPHKVIAVPAIPRTRSGKLSEVAVRETIHGRALKNREALANPECLTLYENLQALQE